MGLWYFSSYKCIGFLEQKLKDYCCLGQKVIFKLFFIIIDVVKIYKIIKSYKFLEQK